MSEAVLNLLCGFALGCGVMWFERMLERLVEKEDGACSTDREVARLAALVSRRRLDSPYI